MHIWLEYYCTGPRTYGTYNHTHYKTFQETHELQSVGPAEARNIFDVAFHKNLVTLIFKQIIHFLQM